MFLREGDAEMPAAAGLVGRTGNPRGRFERRRGAWIASLTRAMMGGRPTPLSLGEAEAIQHAASDEKIAFVASGIQAEFQ